MIGLVLALLAGFSFSMGGIFIRRGVYRSGESFSGVVISLFLGMVLFGVVLLISGGAGQLASLSWLGASALVGAGVVHFIFGRILSFTSIRLIGANRAFPIQTCSVLFAVLLGIVFLGEPLTVTLVLAVFLIFGGVILVSTSGSSKAEKSVLPEGSFVKGVLAALGAALCWGVSPILVRIGVKEVASPLVAAFISYTAASIIISISLFNPGNIEKFRRLSRSALVPFVIAAVAVLVAQLLRYTALDYSLVTLVVPLLATQSLFIFPLSFLINRRIEAFNLRIIMGALIVVFGVSLIFWVA